MDYDVIVIGGGSAGTSAASTAAQAGARTLMINDGELGGLCILRGCMPTKAMLASAHALHDAGRVERFGLRSTGLPEVDFPRLMDRKARYVARFKAAKIRGIEAGAYEVLDGRARFVPGGGVEVDGRRLDARGYVIATGSIPTLLEIPGMQDVPIWTSDDVMKLKRPPAALIVQGAGPIGLELAQFFARIGTRVLLVNRSPLLSHFDLECGEELGRTLLAEERLELAVPGGVEELKPDGDGLVARIRHAGQTREFRADALLMATGRRAALDDLGLEHTGICIEDSHLGHDTRMRTFTPSIWVAGDATGRHEILHIANQEGRVAGHNAAGTTPEKTIDYRLKMTTIFTDPPFASVGESAVELEGRGADFLTGSADLPRTGRAITMETDHGLWRVHADRRSGEILGASLLGPRADDLIHVISAVMHYRGTVDDLLEMPWYHPTLSEVFLDPAREIRSLMP